MVSDASMLAQPRRHTGLHNPISRKRKSPAPGSSSTMNQATGSQDWRAARIRDWLLLLLRFAITRDPTDEAAALAMADEIDALGLDWRPSAPSFFRRTSAEVCKALVASDDAKRTAILKRFIAWIDEPRLQQAFQAAVGLEDGSSKDHRQDLWTGLRHWK